MHAPECHERESGGNSRFDVQKKLKKLKKKLSHKDEPSESDLEEILQNVCHRAGPCKAFAPLRAPPRCCRAQGPPCSRLCKLTLCRGFFLVNDGALLKRFSGTRGREAPLGAAMRC
jgi:hypothetical protein